MRNVLITCVWIAVGAVALGACKLDSRVTATGTGTAPEAQCAAGAVCDSGIPGSSTRNDGAVTQTDVKPVMTGQQTDQTNVNASTGGMSGGSGTDAAVKEPPPPPKKPDGEVCAANSDCISNHCLRELCCTGGDCCKTAADCPTNIIDGQQVACNEPSSCQGKRGEIRCENFLCVADGDVPDDTACTADHMAQDCSPYKPVFCNGNAEQEAPACPTSCNNDTACIEEAHCDMASKTCVMDVEDGGDCSADHECESNHCNRNICCAAGDCCRDETQCFRYNSLPMCADVQSCTGTQKIAVCKANQCSNEEMSSPAACNGTFVEGCGLYPDVTCRNGVRASCATSCRVDSQCKPEAYCRQTSRGGVCERRLKDGDACTTASQCQTNICNHGFCCNDSNPDTYCCGSNDDCRMLERNECVPDLNSCDGRRLVATCNNEHRCRISAQPDPNACTDRSIDCGAAYRSRAACPLGCGCTSDLDCSDGHKCNKQGNANRGVCVVDDTGGMPGMPPPMP